MSGTWTINGLKRGLPFASKMPGDRPVVGGIGAQAIDRLGREGHQTARAQQIGGARDVGVGGRNQFGLLSGADDFAHAHTIKVLFGLAKAKHHSWPVVVLDALCRCCGVCGFFSMIIGGIADERSGHGGQNLHRGAAEGRSGKDHPGGASGYRMVGSGSSRRRRRYRSPGQPDPLVPDPEGPVERQDRHRPHPDHRLAHPAGGRSG